MSNREHTSQLRRNLNTTKDRLVEDAMTSEKKKLKRVRRRHYQQKSALDLARPGCYGCNRTSCQSYVKGLEDKKLIGEPYGCSSLKI
ncbi:MAG: hypothetical protein ACFFAU_01200 [Candidatus Hodarchaeota archaeon]